MLGTGGVFVSVKSPLPLFGVLGPPLCACRRWELIGLKNACEVRDGTCVRLVELGGRALEDVPDLGIPPGPRREGGDCDHGLRVETAALPVPGREDWTLCLFVEVR